MKTGEKYASSSTLTVQAPQGTIEVPQAILMPHPRDNRVLVTTETRGLFAIHDPNIDAVILKDQLSQDFQKAVGKLPHKQIISDYMKKQNIRFGFNRSARNHCRRMLEIQKRQLMELYRYVTGDIPRFVTKHKTSEKDSDAIKRYHVDNVSYIMGMALIGPGIEWLPGTRDHNLAYGGITDNKDLPPHIQPESIANGDILLMKGEDHNHQWKRRSAETENQCYSLIHRSDLSSPRLNMLAYRRL